MPEYIEREALVKYFQERFDWLRKASEKPVGGGKVIIDTELQTGAIIAKEFLDKAKAAKTADVEEVRHGEWYLIEYEYLTCNKCGHWYYTGCESTAEAKEKLHNGDTPNYCPNCGAKMDGKGE